MKKNQIIMPKFVNEAQEADWWATCMKGFAAKRAGREGFATVGHSQAARGAVRPVLR